MTEQQYQYEHRYVIVDEDGNSYDSFKTIIEAEHQIHLYLRDDEIYFGKAIDDYHILDLNTQEYCIRKDKMQKALVFGGDDYR